MASFSEQHLATYCPGSKVSNHGESGATAADLRELLEVVTPDAVKGYSHIWLSIGGNDVLESSCSISPPRLKRRLDTIIARLRAIAPTIQIVLTGYCLPSAYIPGCDSPSALDILAQAMKAVAHSFSGVTFVDSSFECGASASGLLSDSAYFVDSVHLNEIGYCRVFSQPELQSAFGCAPAQFCCDDVFLAEGAVQIVPGAGGGSSSACAGNTNQKPTPAPTSPPTPNGQSVPTFDWGICGGGQGEFTVDLRQAGIGQHLGVISSNKVNVVIELTAEEDLDIQLYDTEAPGWDVDRYPEGKAVVAWCKGDCHYGLMAGANDEEIEYRNMTVRYSGYNGQNGRLRDEYIHLKGSTPSPFSMSVLAFVAGKATVRYSWDDTHSACCRGTAACGGKFEASVPKQESVVIGDVPVGKKDLVIELRSDKDVDIQLYDLESTYTHPETGISEPKAIVAWCKGTCNKGVLGGSSFVGSTEYEGLKYEYSGYGEVNGKKGHEYIRIHGFTNRKLRMTTFGYASGIAEVEYSYWDATFQV